tara:strand:- start:821 stop:1315 length:495 start_codon:yes stop_codon:yes gene_type:complete
MITAEILEKQFVTAHFIDNNRTQIEVMTLESPSSDTQISTVIEYDTNHPWCQELLKVCDLDTLHENTWTRIQNQRKQFERSVIKIARDEGLVFSTHKSETKFHTAMMDFLFNFKVDQEKEDLFAFKLASFELDIVKNCKDKNQKAAIRKAQSPLDVVKAISDIK